MNIIFMGTPDFAVNALEAVIAAGHNVQLVVTQPDKPKGRGKAMQFPAVKECALMHNLPVFQPDRIKKPENIDVLKQYDCDVMVVAAFGQILPKEILDMPKHCCINIHASLLPKYRGSSPIQWSVINGDKVTGVSIQRMDVGVDTGDIISYKEYALSEDETGGSLFDKLAELGATLCVETLEAIANGTATYTPQKEEEASHTKMIAKELGEIDWNMPAGKIECLIRGLNPWPSAYTYLDGKTFKIWRARVLEETEGLPEKTNVGVVYKVDKKGIYVKTGDGALQLLEVQLEGKKRMDVAAFLNGFTVEAGKLLG